MMALIWGLMSVLSEKMRSKLLFILLLFLFFFKTQAQNQKLAVVFYNAENLFDWKDNPLTMDDEFTPEGDRHWTFSRFEQKINNTSKVLLNAVGWDIPAIVGLCEIENRNVLELLTKETALKSIPYQIIHKESPDPRGIDVALLYNSDIFYPLTYEYLPLRNEDGGIRETREILYVSGILSESDTIHVFVNHWPSRYSGLLETKPLRNNAAALLREKVDSVFVINKEAKIIIIGDFNDQPLDESIETHLNAKGIDQSTSLIDLSDMWINTGIGTLKYQSQWYVFDQIIISSNLLDSGSGIYTKPQWATIVSDSFLLEPDERYGGIKPFRTYNGYQYKGGFGDHLPVKLQLDIR